MTKKIRLAYAHTTAMANRYESLAYAGVKLEGCTESIPGGVPEDEHGDFDPARADTILTANGWTRAGEWIKDGPWLARVERDDPE